MGGCDKTDSAIAVCGLTSVCLTSNHKVEWHCIAQYDTNRESGFCPDGYNINGGEFSTQCYKMGSLETGACDGGLSCRSDICTDYWEDCCAPGDEHRGCSIDGYYVASDPTGTSGYPSCVSEYGQSSVYKCCTNDHSDGIDGGASDSCRSDICTDIAEDCCAPGDEHRGCSIDGYYVASDPTGYP